MSNKLRHTYYLTFILFNFLALLQHKQIFAQQITDFELKSSFLFNFKKFVDWPQDVKTLPFTIVIYDNPAFADVIERLAKGMNSKENKWIIKHASNIDEISDCNLVYITNKKNSEIVELLQYLQGKSILTVSDNLESFCDLGGMINFNPKTNQHRLDMNIRAARESKIKISANLIELARVVEK